MLRLIADRAGDNPAAFALFDAVPNLRALLKFVDAYIPEAARREKAEQLARTRKVADSIIAANEELAKGKPVTLTLELDPVTALAGTLNFIIDTAPDELGRVPRSSRWLTHGPTPRRRTGACC